MVWALAIPAVVALVSAGAQYLNSRNAQNASAEERARIKSMLDKIQDPDFDVSMITPEELKSVGKYVPNAIPLINEAAPQIMKAQGQGAIAGRGAQMDALQRYRELARSGQDPILAMQQAQAARQAAAEASSARRTGQMEAQRRGFGYSPMANVGAGQDAMQRLALTGQANAADAYNRRNQALGQAATLGGQLYQQDVDMERLNADIINSFNQRLARNTQDIMAQNVGNMNQAQLRNLGEAQRIADANVAGRNAARSANQGVRNAQAQQQFQNRLNKVNAYAGQSQQEQNAIMEAAKQQNQAFQGVSDLAMKGFDYYYGAGQNKDKNDKLVRG